MVVDRTIEVGVMFLIEVLVSLDFGHKFVIRVVVHIVVEVEHIEVEKVAICKPKEV